jgi:hypothetical protein
MNEKHAWTIPDDLIALYLYKFGDQKLPYSKTRIASERGISADEMDAEILRFKFLDLKGGLPNPSEQAQRVYDSNSYKTEEELRKTILQILSMKGV